MKCTDLAQRIEQLRPGASVREVARLCLLLTNSTRRVEELSDDQTLRDAWREMDLRMRAATDQHAAMTEDLECLDFADLPRITTSELWQLIRTFHVQSQILRLYVGQPASQP